MKLPLLLALTASVFAAEKSACICETNTTGTICLDRKNVVTPLPQFVPANSTVIVRVVNKSPFEKVTFKSEVVELDNTSEAAFGKLFALLGKIVLATPAPGFSILSVDSPKPPPPPPLKDPELNALVNLIESQHSSHQTDIQILKSQFKKAKENLRSLRDGTIEKDCNPATFEPSLEAGIKVVEDVLKLPLLSSGSSSLLVDRLTEIIRKNSVVSLQLSSADLTRINTILENQSTIDTDMGQLSSIHKTLSDVGDVLANVKATKATWFAAEEKYSAENRRKATIEISTKPYDGADGEKLATVVINWLNSPRFSLSLGFTISSVAKREFQTETVRDPSKPLTDPSAFSYRINETITRPIIFPASLIHIKIGDWSRGTKGFAVTGGAGVDPSGDSPTGELLFGVSFRLGNVFISPLAHLARRDQLADNYKVLEATPDPGSFKPPTVTRWKPGFTIALTYRLPL